MKSGFDAAAVNRDRNVTGCRTPCLLRRGNGCKSRWLPTPWYRARTLCHTGTSDPFVELRIAASILIGQLLADAR
jgi:hypothetical protein